MFIASETSLRARLSVRRGRLFGRLVGLSVIISYKSEKFHFHVTIGALVILSLYLEITPMMQGKGWL